MAASSLIFIATFKRGVHSYRGMGSVLFKLGTDFDVRNLQIVDIKFHGTRAEHLAKLVYTMFVR